MTLTFRSKRERKIPDAWIQRIKEFSEVGEPTREEWVQWLKSGRSEYYKGSFSAHLWRSFSGHGFSADDPTRG